MDSSLPTVQQAPSARMRAHTRPHYSAPREAGPTAPGLKSQTSQPFVVTISPDTLARSRADFAQAREAEAQQQRPSIDISA